MFLHEDKELFSEVIEASSISMKLPVAIIEKDYYVTVFLKTLVKLQPDIVFKGGTSLSKCYKLIDRFSEDIDLNIEGELKPSESKRKKLKENIIKVINSLGFVLANESDIFSRRDFNKYEINYPLSYGSDYLKHNLIVETAVFFRAYPSKTMIADSFIYNYLFKQKLFDIINEFDLSPFEIKVQTAERTFIDKLFALGDYYLDNKTAGHSRHIYDLYKLLEIVSVNDDLKSLAETVRKERQNHRTCLSAGENVDMRDVLREIIDTGFYENDYTQITKSLLFTPVEYKDAIRVLEIVLDKNLFD